MGNKELPEISYKVSLDYGEVWVDTRMSESTEFVVTVPLICRIGRKMSTNTVVLGEDLYKKISLLPRLNEDFTFESIGEFTDSRKKAPYFLYSLSRRQKQS